MRSKAVHTSDRARNVLHEHRLTFCVYENANGGNNSASLKQQTTQDAPLTWQRTHYKIQLQKKKALISRF
jgi:hypothetical protein